MLRGEAFRVLLEHNVVTGATMMFRAKYKGLVLPIPDDLPAIHDGWIALLISAVADVQFIPGPLILYRQHEQQQIGAQPRHQELRLSDSALGPHKTTSFRAHLHLLQALYNRLDEGGNNYCDAAHLARLPTELFQLQDQMAHLKLRMHLPSSRLQRIIPILRELLSGRYNKFSNGMRSAALDLYLTGSSHK